MPQIGVAQLFDDNADALDLKWVSGSRESAPFLDSADVNQSSQGLIGHLNLVHPNWIQIFSRTEAAYFSGLNEQAQREALERISGSGLVCIILSDSEQAPPSLADFGTDRNVAEFVTRHGVLLDVLGMGVLLTGESGVGKSELALELISRGSGLVADDVVELYHIGPSTLEGRSPQLLTDFLEVRGLGMLNIRTIFGETAVRRRKNLKLIVQLEKPVGGNIPGVERLPLNASVERILDVDIRTVQLPVAAGRNLAVLVEAAVRNYVLQLRGIDSTQEFIQRQEGYLGSRE
jgi:HPr kinase/phosphorylase